ncbi:LptA/OstA family protein [Pararhodobacter marinus]|uniref:Lipopolysaccharide transport periplasmic protein LptA n=1 Tax=Pararhodobacter marinus TaxID=2184063 RepID=A0A2U2CIJ0_9RHOB|nr:LptA/OstA family protein [Pararhodobacter marinus]PWE31661.1 lipopolysaccharide transport periplasmic protein LptA [Pararhodobacter marinus]
MPRRHLRLIQAFLLALSLAATGSAGSAQTQDGVQITFGESLRLSGAEIEVTADQLSVDQTSGSTEFTGNVMAVQGEMRIAAGAIRLEYSTGARSGTQRISRLIASGGVTMTTPNEALEARTATYVLDSQSLEMQGDVLLVQGPNMLSGERFVADLRAGNGRMIGRVRTVIRME